MEVSTHRAKEPWACDVKLAERRGTYARGLSVVKTTSGQYSLTMASGDHLCACEPRLLAVEACRSEGSNPADGICEASWWADIMDACESDGDGHLASCAALQPCVVRHLRGLNQGSRSGVCSVAGRSAVPGSCLLETGRARRFAALSAGCDAAHIGTEWVMLKALDVSKLLRRQYHACVCLVRALEMRLN